MCYHHSDDAAYTAHLESITMTNIPNDERVECVHDDESDASTSDDGGSRMEEAIMNDDHNPISLSHQSDGLRYGRDFKDGEPYTQEDVDSDLNYLSFQQTAMTSTMMNLYEFVHGSLTDMRKDMLEMKAVLERVETLVRTRMTDGQQQQ